jgi:two-component system, OmpR family, sensor histidine kinase ChvG
MITRRHGLKLWRRVRAQTINAQTLKERMSPITLRILAVNVMALAILMGSLLYLGRYQDRLIASELDSMQLQARLSASALGEGAVVVDEQDRNILSPLLARLMIRRLVEASETRTRLFDTDDTLLADSRILLERGSKIQVEELAEPSENRPFLTDLAMKPFDLLDRLFERQAYPLYQEDQIQRGDQYEIVRKARAGEPASQVWSRPHGGLLLAVAVPVQRYKQVLGAVMLTRPDVKIDQAVSEVRLNILRIFGITLLITVLLSFYLARAIARPLRQLALAAEKVRHKQMQIVGLGGSASALNRDAIPDLSYRKDEIGDLSISLRDMTAALAKRIGAIENFAADVAHEIKNPLTSLRSAVETAEKIRDPALQKQLMLVIRDDVDRLDRLISDISNASRLDAELSRAEAEVIDVCRMLSTLVDFYNVTAQGRQATAMETSAKVELGCLPDVKPKVIGVEVRIVQVLQNLISNALSFSPPHGLVTLSVKQAAPFIQIIVDDEGPGIPENKLDAIFDRFYSERPKAEKFGIHSGLGLSISKQIVEAHYGRLWAENRKDLGGNIVGSRFIVQLPGM